MTRGSIRALGAAALAALMAAGCGGSSPTTPAPEAPTAIVNLDSANFDALVLASPRPSVVEFHNPT
jgi:hypothetical protein